MARIPYVERGSGTSESKELYDELFHGAATGQFGFRDVPNVMKALANSPKLARRISQLGQYFISELSLDPRLRELAVLILIKSGSIVSTASSIILVLLCRPGSATSRLTRLIPMKRAHCSVTTTNLSCATPRI